jgi:hypothetical protein
MKLKLLSLFVSQFVGLILFSQSQRQFTHQLSLGCEITHFDDERGFITKEFFLDKPWLNLPTISYNMSLNKNLGFYFDLVYFESFRNNTIPTDLEERFILEQLLFTSLGYSTTIKETKRTFINTKVGLNNKWGTESYYSGKWFGWHPLNINYQAFDFGPEIAIKGNVYLTNWLFISGQFKYVYYLIKRNQETSTHMYFIQPSIGFELNRKKKKTKGNKTYKQ